MDRVIALKSHRKNFPIGWFLLGAFVGSIAAILLDPNQGHRRRALVKSKGIKLRNHTAAYVTRLGRNLKNKAEGMKFRAGELFSSDHPDDDTLKSRVRSAMGRKVAHARSIGVNVHDGMVTLTGPVLRDELKDLINCVRRVRGVRQVIHELDVHQTPENIPGLQGEGKPYLQ